MKRFFLSLTLALNVFAVPLLAALSVDGSEELLPQGFTAEELTRTHEIGSYVPASAPPPSGTRNPAEYEPMTGVLVRWPLGVPYNLLDSISDHIKLWMVVSSANRAACSTGLAGNGINMAKVGYVIASTNSIWTRDYGPWYVMKPDGRQGIFDFAYNRPRPQDDAVPGAIGTAWGIPVYSSVLVHTGGNYMSGGHGQSMSTDLVYAENDSSNAWVDNQMLQYLGVDDYQALADPQDSYIDHIDCWAKIISPTKVLVLQMPPSHVDYDALEDAAAYLATQPNHYGGNWEVVRVYSGGDEGYTNSTILNDYVYVPLWNTSNDAAALQVYRDALPGYHIVGNYYYDWLNTDAIHCRTMGVTDSAMLWISHKPVAATQPAGTPVAIKSLVRCHPNFSLTSTRCLYRYGTSGAYDSLTMTSVGSDSFSASIPGASAGDTVEYYLSATDNSGRAEQQPRFAPASWRHRYVAAATGVAQGPATGPAATIGTLQAAPNPATNGTAISFQLAGRSQVRLTVYDIAGRNVRSLLREELPAGRHSVRWDGKNQDGAAVGSGVYFVALNAGGSAQRMRLVVVR
ncbi:MAG: agmatine deiminase family protein [Candidatus Edwardsbacteria bacterium]|nr:agmatine deiminase family protein [Candidatus Edwardsbacteria bacterium]